MWLSCNSNSLLAKKDHKSVSFEKTSLGLQLFAWCRQYHYRHSAMPIAYSTDTNGKALFQRKDSSLWNLHHCDNVSVFWDQQRWVVLTKSGVASDQSFASSKSGCLQLISSSSGVSFNRCFLLSHILTIQSLHRKDRSMVHRRSRIRNNSSLSSNTSPALPKH